MMASDKSDNRMLTEQVVEAAETELDATLNLAFTRTWLAFDRTLLAWIRTALTLMAAGIAYDKGFRFLHEERLEAGTAWVRSAHIVGISVTGAVTLLLAAVTVYHFMSVRSLVASRRGGISQALPTILAALLVILLGCSVFVVLVVTSP